MNLQPWKVATTCRWYNFKKTIRLYHGTSSENLPQIIKNGLTLPPENDVKILEIMEQHGFLIHDPKRMCQFKHNFGYPWSNHHEICLTTSPHNAASYAKNTYQNAGELETLLKCFLSQTLHKKIPPRYPNAIPVVIEVLIPTGWVHPEDAQRLKGIFQFWQESECCEGMTTQETQKWLDKERKKHEIRIAQAIPPTHIKRIMQPNN